VAVFDTARRLARIVYRMLCYGQDYVDVGEKAYELRFQARRLAGIKEAARALGYTLLKEPAPEIAG
jgi:transposase